MSDTLKLTWLSHGSWLIEAGACRLLLDPFYSDNPAAKISADSLSEISHVIVSHAHFDHVQDVASIVNRCGATLIGSFEVVQWFQKKHGVKQAVMMNIGGNHSLPCGQLKMVPALHSSSFSDGEYGGNPAGYVLTVENKRIYFACDTAYFSDMRFYAHRVDVAVLPIGDLFTMGIEDSIAAIKLIEPKVVLPAHYGTWSPIAVDAQVWADRVRNETTSQPVVLEVSQPYEL